MAPSVTKSPPLESGCVILVGAGPGAADLITVRGSRWLRRADVILYDYLANPALLATANPNAELVCLGKHGRERVWTQDQINQRIVSEALQGRCVVRLKGGDPSVFGCLAQELQTIIDAQIPFEIVPGVTAATAAAAGTGIAVTHRDWASAVALVTGREDHEKVDSALDYPALAKFPGTLVFYMGTTTVESWASGLLAAGKPPETPVAIVRRASMRDQELRHTHLAQVASIVRGAEPLRPPVVFVIGPVASESQRLVGRRLLRGDGQTVLVTRPAQQADGLVQCLNEAGYQATVWPALKVVPPADWSELDRVLDLGNHYDIVAFSSANGVDALIDRLLERGSDSRWLASSRLAAVGPATAQRLRLRGLRADIVPDRFDAASLAAAIASASPHGKRVLFPAGAESRPELSTSLENSGFDVTQVTVYQTVPQTSAAPYLLASMEAGQWNWTTVTSPRIAETLVQVFGQSLAKTKLVSISPLTSQKLRDLGLQVSAEARQASDEAICAAIRQHASSSSPSEA